jgi:hypothetical protein
MLVQRYRVTVRQAAQVARSDSMPRLFAQRWKNPMVCWPVVFQQGNYGLQDVQLTLASAARMVRAPSNKPGNLTSAVEAVASEHWLRGGATSATDIRWSYLSEADAHYVLTQWTPIQAIDFVALPPNLCRFVHSHFTDFVAGI